MMARRQRAEQRLHPWRADPMQDEGSYVCDSCGEEIVVPIDLSQGSSQAYEEDCPVCCRPMLVHVRLDREGHVEVWAEGC